MYRWTGPEGSASLWLGDARPHCCYLASYFHLFLALSSLALQFELKFMFKSILTGLASGQGVTQGTGTGTSKGVTPAQLRQDIYNGMDGICAWIASGKAENGIDCRTILVGEFGTVVFERLLTDEKTAFRRLWTSISPERLSIDAQTRFLCWLGDLPT